MGHPNHKQHLPNIRRIEGQMRGIAKMIDEEQYCVDILNQLKAVGNAIRTVEGKILQTHLRQCVKDSLRGEEDFETKIDEILKLMKR